MKTQKMSLSAIKGALSRSEMKKIMAGSYCNISGAICDCHYVGGRWCCTNMVPIVCA